MKPKESLAPNQWGPPPFVLVAHENTGQLLCLIGFSDSELTKQSANHPHTRKPPHAVSEYVELYNRERQLQGLNNELVVPELREIKGEAEVKVKSRLGGLLNFYYR